MSTATDLNRYQNFTYHLIYFCEISGWTM